MKKWLIRKLGGLVYEDIPEDVRGYWSQYIFNKHRDNIAMVPQKIAKTIDEDIYNSIIKS